jgi:RAD51-like protein 2
MKITNTTNPAIFENIHSILLPIKLSNLPLKPCTISVLQRRGFVTIKDVSDARKGGIRNLAEELGVSLPEAVALSKEVDATYHSVLGQQAAKNEGSVSAAEILRNHRNDRPIVTFCEQIDSMLGGGVAIGEITECCGEPGTGKTQMGMQIAVDARIPVEYGGVAGEAVYIDTEGSFAPDRCWSMAQALVNHIQSCAARKKRASKNCSSSNLPSWFTVECILDGIHVFRCHDEAAQTATIMALPTFLQAREKLGTPIKLIVVDSIAFHFRVSFDSFCCFIRMILISLVTKVLKMFHF